VPIDGSMCRKPNLAKMTDVPKHREAIAASRIPSISAPIRDENTNFLGTQLNLKVNFLNCNWFSVNKSYFTSGGLNYTPAGAIVKYPKVMAAHFPSSPPFFYNEFNHTIS
jgi:hypothetical protein